MPVYEPLSPMWWVARLHKKLIERQPRLDLWERYYTGDHPLPYLHEKARTAFRRLLRMSRSNYMQLVVDAAATRLQVDGFRMPATNRSGPGSTDVAAGDSAAWRIWQANALDAESDLVFTEALKLGNAYMLVEPNRDDSSTPTITPEHPAQAIVEYHPGSRRRRAAGLKEFADDWTGRRVAALYLPDTVWTYTAPELTPGSAGVSEPAWELNEDLSGPNPLGEVPLVEYPNRPSMLAAPASEIAGVADIQARINKTLADRLMAQEFGAFAQKWVTGMDIPRDENGIEVEPFDVAVNRILVAEHENTKFGQFDATDLNPYLAAVRDDIRDIAAITSTPPHYLLGDIINLSAEALKAAEAGLVAKVRNRMRHLGEAVEETMRLALIAAGDPRGSDLASGTASEVVWSNPEHRTEGELVDALVKMHGLGVPAEALWERWGASPQEIQRWKTMRADAADRILAGDLAAFEGPKPALAGATAGAAAGGV